MIQKEFYKYSNAKYNWISRRISLLTLKRFWFISDLQNFSKLKTHTPSGENAEVTHHAHKSRVTRTVCIRNKACWFGAGSRAFSTVRRPVRRSRESRPSGIVGFRSDRKGKGVISDASSKSTPTQRSTRGNRAVTPRLFFAAGAGR